MQRKNSVSQYTKQDTVPLESLINMCHCNDINIHLRVKMIQLVDGPTIFFSFCVFTYKPIHKHIAQHHISQIQK